MISRIGHSPVLEVAGLSKIYSSGMGCRDIEMEVWPGEVLAIVGESGSGKSTLLNCLSGIAVPTSGSVRFRSGRGVRDLVSVSEMEKRQLMRSEMGIVHQNPRDGLRMGISAGGNIGERLMALGSRNYSAIRNAAGAWLDRVEIGSSRINDFPAFFSGGMQQRLQIARCLVTGPKLVFMDEPTSGLDVSVQARLLDILRRLARELSLSIVMVTHDLAVARMLAHRMMVMKDGCIVESGLTDQILDDPGHPYTQLLVSSILQH
jgi:putative phosphonate transport system ATP-binding protein